jgi:hypothetical protein
MSHKADFTEAESMDLLWQSGRTNPLAGLRCGDVINGVRWYVFQHTPENSDRPIAFIVNSRREVYHQIDVVGNVTTFTGGYAIPDLRSPAIQGWSVEGIREWIESDYDGEPEDLKQLHAKIQEVLKKQVYCLSDCDYELLALYAIASFYFPLFNATPFLHIGGGYGSGKSHAASVLLRVSYNGYSSEFGAAQYGKITAPALCRAIDGGGVVCLDDLEQIFSQASPSPMRQSLLTSHLQSTSREAMIEIGRSAPRTFRLFGPKIFTAIGTPDPVLGSRCLKVSLPRAPASWKPTEVTELEYDQISNLGYRLAMSPKVLAILQAEAMNSTHGGRLGQITQGLRAIAQLVGEGSLALLEQVLAASKTAKDTTGSPFDALIAAVSSILREGYMTISLVHLQAELRIAGVDMHAAGIARLGINLLFRSVNRVIIHGFKSADLAPTSKAFSMAKVSGRSAIRRARSFCPQSDRKVFDQGSCSLCRYSGHCAIERRQIQKKKGMEG